MAEKYKAIPRPKAILLSACLVTLLLAAILAIGLSIIREENTESAKPHTEIKTDAVQAENAAVQIERTDKPLAKDEAAVNQPDAQMMPETNEEEEEEAPQASKEEEDELEPEELAEEYPIFSGDQFNQLFSDADLPNLTELADTEPPEITGDAAVDAGIRALAEDRGYQRRPEVLNIDLLVSVEEDRFLLQPAAVAAYLELRAATADAGHNIHIVSAFRSYDRQREILLEQIESPYADEEVNEVLRRRSVPGYSKHHTGYAIDLAEGVLTFDDFTRSASYAWLAADNYLNAKRHGWIPSYPPDAQKQGPDPESWEFTFVGKEYLLNKQSL